MKRKVIKDENIGGVNTVIETVEQTKEDGFVPETEIHEIGNDRRGKYSYGASKHFRITTNNPNITKPFLYGICVLFLIIGIIMLLLKNYLFGAVWTIITIYFFFQQKKEIDKVEEEIRQQGGSVIKSNMAEDWKELGEITKEGFQDSCQATLTKENFKWFSKLGIICMSIVTPILSVIIGLIVGAIIGLTEGIILGILVFVICVLGTLLYLFILSKIFKY